MAEHGTGGTVTKVMDPYSVFPIPYANACLRQNSILECIANVKPVSNSACSWRWKKEIIRIAISISASEKPFPKRFIKGNQPSNVVFCIVYLDDIARKVYILHPEAERFANSHRRSVQESDINLVALISFSVFRREEDSCFEDAFHFSLGEDIRDKIAGCLDMLLRIDINVLISHILHVQADLTYA